MGHVTALELTSSKVRFRVERHVIVPKLTSARR
jgi:hypothetical protein